MADAAARILVDALDELRDRVRAVADDVPGRASRRGDQFAVDDQQPVVVALEEALDDHRPRMLARDREALCHFRVACQPDGDAAAVVAVVRFRNDREADALRGPERLRFSLDELLLRHGQAERGEDLVGLLLVAGELDGNVRGAAGDRRLDALLILSMTQLHQRLVIEP